ncbi:MAG: ParB/RepB/Spo0J family partition protein [Alcaligenaceae bacterium]|nr:ParB/RepB/Spo0J family partition protein [Alcaligenaceae bacterium]
MATTKKSSSKKSTTTKKVARPKKNALGRGLSNLLNTDLNVVNEINKNLEATTKKTKEIVLLKLNLIQSGQYQPRQQMDDDTLEELALSIKEEGVLQPILVRLLDKNKYEIIAGERRYLASKKAGLKEIPAIITALDNKHAAAVSLIENMQRQDLKPLEEAIGIQRLIKEFELTHEQAAESLGKSRSSVSNLLRLLNLSKEVQKLLNNEEIELGHAKLLMTLDPATQVMLAHKIISLNWSVRDTEKYLTQIKQKKINKKPVVDQNIQRIEERMSDVLGTSVMIKQKGKKKGFIQINFDDLNHFDSLLKRLNISIED